MKKILLAFDKNHFSEGAFEFARRLNEIQPVLLTGIFLPQSNLVDIWSYANPADGIYIPLVDDNEPELIRQNIDRFAKLCQANDIDYTIHKELNGPALPTLKQESSFADLLILGSQVFYGEESIELSNNYLEDVLHNIACPVILVPEKFTFPESILLAYDGSENAVYAIKQFAYLFPELTSRNTLLIYSNGDSVKDFPDEILVEELAARHFESLTLFKLTLNPRKHFAAWISDRGSAMLVCGSYGRSGLSRLFQKSFVKDVIADHQLPVFIAHK